MKSEKLFKKGNRVILTMIIFMVSLFFINTNVSAEELYSEVSDVADLRTAITNGENVKLTASFEVSETIKITEKDIILDLNGYTITGIDNKSSGNFNLFEIFKGELTIRDTVGSGTITLRANTNRYWNAMSTIIENHTGVLNIEGGTFTHLGGSDMAYVVDVNANSSGDSTLNVYDGTFYSPYTAIRLYMASAGTAYLNVHGGVIDGGTSAVWAQAPESKSGQTSEINIFDGELGVINTARTELADVDTVISGGKIESIKSEAKELKITGGHIEGILNILSPSGELVESDEIITGGTFGVDPKGFIASSVSVNASITNGEDSMYAVGEDSVREMSASASQGSIIEINGDINLEEVSIGVIVKATEGSAVTANGIEVTEEGITIEEEIKNPSTSDNILTSIALVIISLLGLLSSVTYLKKRCN